MTRTRSSMFVTVLGVLCVGLWSALPACAQHAQPTPHVVYEDHHDVSQPLWATPVEPAQWPTLTPRLHQKPERPKALTAAREDPGLQTVAPERMRKHRRTMFPGGGANRHAPPDTNGAAGTTQYVQWVNAEYAVYDKNTGDRLLGPSPGNSFWTGFGGPCETSNDGDAIAQFDKAAGRWVMAQPVYSFPFTYCVAVSTTSDATGSYHRYAFPIPNNYFPDYPKLGVWSDAYYVSFNAFDSSGTAFIGAFACALDRNAMLAGNSANGVCFQNGSNVDSLLPSDLDGSTPPPAGSPDYFVHFVSNALDLYQFHVDFTTPSQSTFTGPATIGVNPFSEACGGGVCIPQAETDQPLDSLGDRLMYRFAYRNFGDHESLVVNHAVTAGSSVGVRWYELRQTPGSGSFSVYQQGTFAPDSSYRWMGSLAMDKAGDIALGYSVSSASMHPSIAYTVHVPGTDALGTMEAETTIINGTGSQTGGLNRWGDYSSMSIDPVDDCTFWYTNEYLQSNGSFNWSTQIASFALANCTGVSTPDFSLSATPGFQTVLQGGSASYTVSASSLNGFTGSVSLSASGGPSGVSIGFTPTSVTAGSGSSTMTVDVASNTTPGIYTLTITGTSGSLVHTATVMLAVQGFSISSSPGSQTVVQGGSTTYAASVSFLNGFTGAVSLSASGGPSGVSIGFTPTSVTAGSGSSTMTVNVAINTTPGIYTLTITGTSGSLSHSTTVTLVVSSSSTPDFSISAFPSSQTAARGASTSYTVTVTALNGFTGAVGFSVSGFPFRTSASFRPGSVLGAGASTLTVGASFRTRTGTYTLSIRGTSGSLVRSTTATLVVR